MKLVVGLGNPGRTYRNTRHNVGFQVVDRLGLRHGIAVAQRRCRSRVGEGIVAGVEVLLAKPQAYMNHSGEAVAALLEATGIPAGSMIVVHDDLDLPLGRLRIKQRGGHGGHRGVQSILEILGHGNFLRVKVGIGPGSGGSRGDAAAYVLSPFLPQEQPVLEEVLERAADAVELLVAGKLTEALNRFNPNPRPLS